MIFAYGFRCCVFKHNICGNYSEVPKEIPDSTDPLPLEFFVNPGCPFVQAATEATTTKVPLNEAAKELMEIAAAEDHGKI